MRARLRPQWLAGSPKFVHCAYVRRRITTSGNSAALLLSQDMLGLMRVQPGDEVEVSLLDRTLVVRPLSEVERASSVASAVDEVFSRRGTALERLARDERPVPTQAHASSTTSPKRRRAPKR